MNKIDKKILIELFKDSRASNKNIGKKVGISKEVTNYRINKLIEEGIIKKFYPIVNMSKLGYTIYRIQFKLKKDKEELIKYLKEINQVSWIIELKGNWDLVCLLWIKNNQEFFSIMDSIQDKFGNIIQRKLFTIVQTIYNSPSNFLDNKSNIQYTIENNSIEKEEINNLERKMLHELLKNGKMPVTELSLKLNSSPTNITYHLKKLINKKIILGFIPQINYSKLNLQYAKVMLEINNTEMKNEIVKKLLSEKSIIYVTKSHGKYDLEFETVVDNIDEIFNVINEISKISTVNDYEIIYNSKEHLINEIPN